MLRGKGWRIDAIDPYHRDSSLSRIDFVGNTKGFLNICAHLKNRGRYDVVICDSVLNSTDSLTAYYDVINSCYGLLKYGGKLFISGRQRVSENGVSAKSSRTTDRHCRTYFLDADGFTANYRMGAWTFQKFCSKEQIDAWARAIDPRYVYRGNENAYQCMLTKTMRLDRSEVLASLRREFDMMLPGGRSYGLSDEIENAYKTALENENNKI